MASRLTMLITFHMRMMIMALFSCTAFAVELPAEPLGAVVLLQTSAVVKENAPGIVLPQQLAAVSKATTQWNAQTDAAKAKGNAITDSKINVKAFAALKAQAMAYVEQKEKATAAAKAANLEQIEQDKEKAKAANALKLAKAKAYVEQKEEAAAKAATVEQIKLEKEKAEAAANALKLAKAKAYVEQKEKAAAKAATVEQIKLEKEKAEAAADALKHAKADAEKKAMAEQKTHAAAEYWASAQLKAKAALKASAEKKALEDEFIDQLMVLKAKTDAERKRKKKHITTKPILFQDVTPYAYPKEWYSWNHAGYPRSHQGTPTFADLNNDGVLDFLYHNHYQADPGNDWDVGLSRGSNDVSEGEVFWTSVGDKLLQCTEPENSKWKTEKAIDNHGTAIIDIDRDGLLDIYMAVGGGDGWVGGPSKNALLMWGEKADTPLKQVFKGGRDASEAAGVHNLDSRGRFNYWADFNKDGLLDVVYSNEPRDDNINAHGIMLINNGDRTFTEHTELSEYTETMVLTDADGDGYAEEFIVQRRDCAPKACKYELDHYCPRLLQQNKAWYDFCTTRPEGTAAVYKWSNKAGKLKNIMPEFKTTKIGTEEHAVSMQTGDFDGDAIVDLVVLYPSSIQFFYSSKRKPGQLPIGNFSEKAAWKKDTCVGAAIRVADLNLDGKFEILVLCMANDKGRPPAHMMFSGEAHAWVQWTNKQWIGDYLNKSLVRPTFTQMQGVCHGNDAKEFKEGLPGYLRKGCEEFTNPSKAQAQPGRFTNPRTMGLTVADWNNDGFLDVSISYDFGQMLLLRNNWGNSVNHHFLAIKLVGVESNQYGVGATVLLKCRNFKNGKKFTQLREVNSVSHELDWIGTHDDRIIFGLGEHGVPESVTVRWPNKKNTVQKIKSKELLIAHMDSMTELLVITEGADLQERADEDVLNDLKKAGGGAEEETNKLKALWDKLKKYAR